MGLITGKVHCDTPDGTTTSYWWLYGLGLVARMATQRVCIYDAADGREYTLAMEVQALCYSKPLQRVWFVDRAKQRAFYFDATQRAFAELTLPGYDVCRVDVANMLEFDTRRPAGRVPFVYDPKSGLGFVAPSSEQRAQVCCHAGMFFLGVRAPNNTTAVYMVPPSPLPTAKSTPRAELRKFIGIAAASTEFYFSAAGAGLQLLSASRLRWAHGAHDPRSPCDAKHATIVCIVMYYMHATPHLTIPTVPDGAPAWVL